MVQWYRDTHLEKGWGQGGVRGFCPELWWTVLLFTGIGTNGEKLDLTKKKKNVLRVKYI